MQSIHSSDDVDSATNNIDKAAHELVCGMSKDQQEWLQYHNYLKHLPSSYTKQPAEDNIIPKRLATVKQPICVACLDGKQHRRLWKGHGKS